ncbi:Uncharacterised protein [Serratia quinivorans]|nr:Uncharacterised protein [Serratia quinivorans]
MAPEFDNGGMVGQFVADKIGQDVLDDGDVANLTEKLGSALPLSRQLLACLMKMGLSLFQLISRVLLKMYLFSGSLNIPKTHL